MPNNTPTVKTEALDIELRRLQIRAELITRVICADLTDVDDPSCYAVHLIRKQNYEAARREIARARELVDMIIDEASK